MSTPAPAARAAGLSRDIVVRTAVRLVEDYDVAALTMRRLAVELGTAVTSIYWHVGNRDALLDLMVEQLLDDLQQVVVRGDTARDRIASLCHEWRQQLWDHPHLIAIAHERGKTATMFTPMQAALATELAAVGLRGAVAATAIRSLQFHVVSAVVMQRTAGRAPTTDVTDPSRWPAGGSDAELVAALAVPIDYPQVFEVGLESLLDRFLLFVTTTGVLRDNDTVSIIEVPARAGANSATASSAHPPAAIPQPLLSVRGLVAQYGARRALSGVDLNVYRGEVVALAGENGAGKSTLVRCIAGDLTPAAGEIAIDGERIRTGPKSIARRGVAVVWQDLALCDNLDVAANLLLGREGRRLLMSDARFHAAAQRLLDSLGIPIHDTALPVSALSGGQRQLVAVARAMRDKPRLLILDEPTASLGVIESAQVEALLRRLYDEGTTILLVSHDIDQMFRLADRIAVVRHGQVVADVPTVTGHPDEVVALISGQPVDSSPRRQLDRLHSLVGQLTSADPSSSLAVILSALGTALAADRLCIHLVEGDRLRLTAAVGLPDDLMSAWTDLPHDDAGPVGAVASSGFTVVDHDTRSAATWAAYRSIADDADIRSSWSVPVTGSGGLVGVITVLRRNRGTPHRDELDLVTLYAGYAASTAERDGLLGEVTARNRVLETIRVVLEQLAVSVPLSAGLDVAVDTLRVGLGADEVGLLGWQPGSEPRCRGWSGVAGGAMLPSSPLLRALPLARDAAATTGPVVCVDTLDAHVLAAVVPTPGTPLTLLAAWPPHFAGSDADAASLLEDAARSLQLALERETSERSHREAVALRRSQELQREFLSRLSHELRTPLTAIHGYADSLLQTDVTWDEDSQTRFLSRITTESARLGRLVGDLLDLSAIESSILRLQRDWCDIALVVDAARACLPLDVIDQVSLRCDPLPAVWADHDRLEQVLVNLMDNAIRHNPTGTTVVVETRALSDDTVVITVTDDGIGMPDSFDDDGEQAEVRRTATSGSGLGLSITRAIVSAHGGTLRLERPETGTWWRIESRSAASKLTAMWRGQRPAMAEQTRVLLVEDDPNIVDLIRSNLTVRGFDMTVSTDGHRALQLSESSRPDLVLLDLMLPGVDGMDLCREMRERSPVGIIVVSARRAERDKISALNMGADDYMTKPFSIEELLARITATLRRSRPAMSPEPPMTMVSVGDIEIDLAGQRVTRGGVEIHLTTTEFALLRELAVDRGKLLSHADLLRRVWGVGYQTETEYVRVYIRRLRAKLETEGMPRLIITQPRAGYRLAAE